MQLTKNDVARRQLATAIRLFFYGGDPVSIYSLAANAWEIIDVLCNNAGVESMSNQARQNIPQGKDLRMDYINSPYRNFFKHADRDPGAILPGFRTKNVDGAIFLGVEDYIRLNKKSPLEFQVFQVWYMATNADKVSPPSLQRVLEVVERELPSINEASRERQILMGRVLLEKAYVDEELLGHHQTERAF